MISRGRILDLSFGALAAAQLTAAAVLVSRGGKVALPGGGVLGGMCPSRTLLGVDCPFCGMTRSFVAFTDGRVRDAFVFHPAGPVLAIAMACFVVAALLAAARRTAPLVERRWVVRLCEGVAVACAAAGVFHMMRS
jgi:hypothetical protein